MNRAASLLLLSASLLVGCGGEGAGTTDSAVSPAGTHSTAPAAAATALPPCPRVPRVPPRPDGLPALELPCLGAGPAVRLSDLRGTPTVLNVWAAWCTNCDREMPLFRRAQERAGDRLRFFGVHYKAPRGFGLRSAADFGVPFPSVQDTDGDRTVRALRAYAPPQTLFVTADGRLAGRKIGEIRSAAELAGLVEGHLGVRL